MKKIELTRGYYTQVSDQDYAFLMQHNWYYMPNGYAMARINRKHIRLHRYLMEHILNRKLTSKELIDHIDGNKLNNQRNNLRIVTPQQNAQNSIKNNALKKHSSDYKGVHFKKTYQKWCAKITNPITKKEIYLGLFQNEDDAARAYNKKAIELFGEYAKLNIIGQKTTEIIINKNEIPLTQGQVAQVSPEDYDFLIQWNWKFSNQYAARTDESHNRQVLWMHRIIMEKIINRKLMDNELIDHIDHNCLNNKRENLRIVTARQNSFNKRKLSKKTTSKYKGINIITFKKNNKIHRYIYAVIYEHNKQYKIGRFYTILDAINAYNNEAKKRFGEYAVLNIPDKNDLEGDNITYIYTIKNHPIQLLEKDYNLIKNYKLKLYNNQIYCNNILLSQFIMEHIINRKLTNNESIIHLDNNNLNFNRINLKLIKREE